MVFVASLRSGTVSVTALCCLGTNACGSKSSCCRSQSVNVPVEQYAPRRLAADDEAFFGVPRPAGCCFGCGMVKSRTGSGRVSQRNSAVDASNAKEQKADQWEVLDEVAAVAGAFLDGPQRAECSLG